MFRIATTTIALALAGAVGAQPPTVERPLTKLDRQGRLIQNGVLFHFGDPPRKMREIGQETVVMPHDGPDGEQDFPGRQSCERSMVLALTEMATATREKGGDAVISIGADPARPEVRNRKGYLCNDGRVVVRGTMVSTR